MTYTPPSNDATDFTLEDGYTPPDNDATDFTEFVDTLVAVTQATATADATSVASGAGQATTMASASSTATTQGAGAGVATTQATATTATTTLGSPGVRARTTATATTAATTVATDATYINTRVEWRVTRDGTEVEDAVYDVAPVVDTANPFGDYVVIKMDDRGGDKFDDYARGTRVDVAVSENAGITYDNRFTGYVVERRENEQQGADALEVEAYSFDQFLRRNTVTNDQTGNTIAQALADIIQTDTPVTYEPTNVDVGDDQTLTRSYQGEPVENVLRDFAFKSNNEDFGVNDDLEFFFRPRETTHIDRGIDNTQWFRYDIPELGKETINEVEVWFDDGEESVIVDDGTDKLDLQDSLGLPDPGTQRAELNRPLLTNIADAEDEGRKYLTFRNATLSGTVTTFGLFNAEPGDTIDIEITPRGIDSEFVIAGIEYRWGVDETILTIVEKRGDVDDILSELNDSVQRVEMNGANRDAPKNRITTTNATGIVAVDIDADGNTPNADRYVNDGRRAVRDTWTGETPPDITTLVVGDDNTGLSRSNTALNNQTNSATVTQTLPDATSVTFEATIAQTDVQEVGLETADGRLITRATFDDAVDLDGTVSVTLDVSNDDSVSRGVLTTNGQTAVRDVLADNSPTLPNAYAYGDDPTAVSEADTALGNELVEVSLDEILIQDADTQTEWESLIGDIGATTPFTVDATGPRPTQTCWTREGEDYDAGNETRFRPPDDADEFSDGEWLELALDDDIGVYEITVEHEIPVGELAADIRVATDPVNNSGIDVDVLFKDGDVTLASDTVPLDGAVLTSPTWGTVLWNNGSAIEPGEYTVEIAGNTTNTAIDGPRTYVDVLAPRDDRYTVTLDNTVNSPSGYLDGPERYPELVERSFTTASTRRDVTEASFDLSANDVSGDFYVELANDGSTFTRVDNSETGSVTFAGAERGVDVNIGLGRYSATSTQTPLNGNDPQQIDTWNLMANPDASVSDGISDVLTRGIVPPDTLAPGTTIREAGLKSDSTLLTRHLLAEFSLLEGQRLASAESNRFIGDN